MVLAEAGELTLYVFYLHAMRGLLALAAGDLDLALRHADKAERHQVPTLVIRGAVALRRGEPGVDLLLDEGWALATATTELQRLRPMASLRAEAAWLHGDAAGLNAATWDTYGLALSRGTPWDVGELAVWRWRAGLLDAVPPGLSEPHALEIAGAPAEAAAIWARLGEPYSQALAMLGSQDAEDLRQAIELLDEIGAVAVLPLARARLRDLGATSVPRGRMSSTRRNPGGLTDRQLEVLQLMVAGLTNSEIARRLVLSPKTVEHHVGAILAKLGAASRVEAADAARRLGVVEAAI
jgi:DNA-binding CsgD family transcriptional regulator